MRSAGASIYWASYVFKGDKWETDCGWSRGNKESECKQYILTNNSYLTNDWKEQHRSWIFLHSTIREAPLFKNPFLSKVETFLGVRAVSCFIVYQQQWKIILILKWKYSFLSLLSLKKVGISSAVSFIFGEVPISLLPNTVKQEHFIPECSFSKFPALPFKSRPNISSSQ